MGFSSSEKKKIGPIPMTYFSHSGWSSEFRELELWPESLGRFRSPATQFQNVPAKKWPEGSRIDNCAPYRKGILTCSLIYGMRSGMTHKVLGISDIPPKLTSSQFLFFKDVLHASTSSQTYSRKVALNLR